MSEKAATTMYVTCGNGNMYVCIYTLGAFISNLCPPCWRQDLCKEIL